MPGGLLRDAQDTAPAKGGFGAKDGKENGAQIGARDAAFDKPIACDAAIVKAIAKNRTNFKLGDGLIFARKAKGDTEKPNTRGGIIDTTRDEINFGAGGVSRHGDQLKTVMDCTNRAYEVMAYARPYQRREICIKVTHTKGLVLKGKTGMDDLNAFLEPGMLVRNPERPEWGIGQVQSNIGGKLTVNFREEGKVVINSSRVMLMPVHEDSNSLT